MNAPRRMSVLLPALTEKIIGKRGMLFGKLIDGWVDIVGSDIGLKATPAGLKFSGKTEKSRNTATLTLACTSSYAAELQYQLPYLLERVNGFFGYEAIKDIKIIHKTANPRVRPIRAPRLRKLTVTEQQKIDEATGIIAENSLKEALASFGRALAARRK